MVPFDTESPFVTSGIRVGTPAITTRGMDAQDVKQVVEWMDQILMEPDNDKKIGKIKNEVNDFMTRFPLYPDL